MVWAKPTFNRHRHTLLPSTTSEGRKLGALNHVMSEHLAMLHEVLRVEEVMFESTYKIL